MHAKEFADKWKAACNSHDLDRIMALYSATVVFKSPRVFAVSGEMTGTLHGQEPVREYWRRLLEKRPNLTFAIDRIFAGVDSVALEYRVGEHLHGIEFMVLDGDGLIAFAAGNDTA